MDPLTHGTRTTARNHRVPVEGADIGYRIADIHDGLDALAHRIDALARVCEPGLSEHLIANEGPFTGDPVAALDTTRLWLERSRLMLVSAADAIDQAHVASGGLASR